MTAPDGVAVSAGNGDEPVLDRPVPADWLAARQRADTLARESALPLIERLGEVLGTGRVSVVDLGSGTGANQAYLDPRLPFRPAWVLLDHDRGLLAAPTHGPGRRVLGGVEELAALLEELPAPRVVTCSALLDLLTRDQLDRLARTLVDSRTPALLALTVTGEVRVRPLHTGDAAVAAAFDQHQARLDRPGPEAARYLAERLRELGAQVEVTPTPWRLSARADQDLLRRWLTERAEVAVEQDPSVVREAAGWLADRLEELGEGSLVAEVDHVDLLVLPDS